MLNSSDSIVSPVDAPFKPKFGREFRYWELSIAASRAKEESERAAIWAHWTGPDPVMHPKIQCGYFRLRRGVKGARRFVPVAIWKHAEDLLYYVKVENDMHSRPDEFWERNGQWIEPVSFEDYNFAVENGQWPGDIDAEAPRYDHNADNGGAKFRDDLIELVGKVEAFIAKEVGPAVADRVMADKLANWREALGLAQKTADTQLAEEIAHLKTAIAERKELWRVPIEAAKTAVERIRTLLTPWMQAQVAQGLDVKIGGQAGRKMSQRPYWSAIVTDWGKAVRHFEGHPKLRAVVQELADAAARGKEKTPIDGVEFKSEGRAA
jgi:hypothetical protein